MALLSAAAHGRQPDERPASGHSVLNAKHEVFHYGAEWRFIRAGVVKLEWSRDAGAGNHSNAVLQLQSAGLVSRLHKVDNEYRVNLLDGFAAANSVMKTEEGSRRKETKVTYDAEGGKVEFEEIDLVKKTVTTKELHIPGRVHDLIGGLYRLRTLRPPVGQSVELPISDGKKFITAKVDVQEREMVETPAGKFKTIRYEAHLFNGVLFRRKGRLYIWLTDDERRIPVQIRVKLPFYIGTITLQLERQEKS